MAGWVFSFAFLLMGFTFTITQALMVRELLVAFSGNELSIGLVLGSWLVLEALGSGLLGRLASRFRVGSLAYAGLQLILAVLLPVALYAALAIRTILGVIPGQGLGLGPIFLASFGILLPLGLVDGAMFTFASEAFSRFTRKGVPSVGQVYVLEAVGGIAGGIAFTYLFIPHLNSAQMVLVLAALNLASAVSMAAIAKGHRLRKAGVAVPLLLLAVAAFLLTPPQAEALHQAMVARQWEGYDLAFYGNSVYGNVAAIRQENQYTFFANGIPIITVPVPDITFSEEIVHIPMLFVKDPHRCLVVSGGVGGVLNELLKYPWERLDYAELDPLVIKAVESLPTSLTTRELSDPRVRVEYVDGRLLARRKALETPAPRYDLIILNLPYPSTLQLNRFYTREFFALINSILDEKGVVVIPLPGSLTYLSPGLRSLNLALYKTLEAVFPHIRVIPGDVNLWLASPGNELESPGVDELIRRWQERPVPTSLISEKHLRVRFDERRLAWFWETLRQGGSVAINLDLRPSGLLYGLTYWNELFSPAVSGYFRSLSRINLLHLAVPLALAWLVILALGLRGTRFKEAVIPLAVATTGFGGMTFDLLIIFAFQAFYGYVYQQIGLLITAFMAGLSLGGWLMSRWIERVRGWPTLVKLEVAIVVLWLLFPLSLIVLYTQAQAMGPGALLRWNLVAPVLLLLNALGGLVVGLEFPLANKLYLLGRGLTETAGIIYAADLVGAFLGALLVSVALLPALGVAQTCWLVALLKAGSLAFIIVCGGRS